MSDFTKEINWLLDMLEERVDEIAVDYVVEVLEFDGERPMAHSEWQNAITTSRQALKDAVIQMKEKLNA